MKMDIDARLTKDGYADGLIELYEGKEFWEMSWAVGKLMAMAAEWIKYCTLCFMAKIN